MLPPSSLLHVPLVPFMKWSFGVVCWEVFSLGRKPYPGVDNMDIPDYVSNGHRLKKPALCPDDLYALYCMWFAK